MSLDPLDELLETARRDVDSGWLPACQLAVARDGELLCFETFGAATNTTRFNVYSATKPIVASAIWLLIGDGLLEIDRPVAHYVPEFATSGKHVVTVEQVLLHTAGFPNAPIGVVEGADPVARVKRFESWKLEWEPGTRFEYHAGAAHWVLAELIERLSGDDFRDFVEDRVCAPLGLPRLLGIPPDEQHDIARITPAAGNDGPLEDIDTEFNEPEPRAAGVPGGGGIMTAADLARFYQAVIANPDKLWEPDVLADATTNLRCTLPEPLFELPVNRTIGLVVAGDDGKHTMRYAGFGEGNSPHAFGHAGMHMQIGWGDPETGVSFAYATNGVDADVLKEGMRGVVLAGIAARC